MSRIDFSGQVAVVTGGGGGLGRSYVMELAARGARVLVNGRPDPDGKPSAAEQVVADIIQQGGEAAVSHASFATAAGGQAIIDAAMARWGRVDIVIHNAGNQINARFGEFTENDIDEVLSVHVKGAFNVTQPAYRQMCRQGYGRILLVSSPSAVFGNPYRANYAAAKLAVVGLMNAIAQEAPAGITVNCISPNAAGGRLGAASSGPRIDADFIAEAGARSRQYRTAMHPSFVTPLALWLVSADCTGTQGLYSALGGKYARMFIGLSDGWFSGGEVAPTVEDIAAHWDSIQATSPFILPKCGYDEMDSVIAAMAKHRGEQP